MSTRPHEDLLSERPERRISLQGAATVNARLFIGQGRLATEIVVYESPTAPTNSTLRSLWRARNNGRPTPVIIVANYGVNSSSICGAAGEEPPVLSDLDRGQVERLCYEVLECQEQESGSLALWANDRVTQ